MIPSLHISGFKLFRDINLPKLGRLNLFVGKNNTGKSCLLEAVELYASSSLREIVRVALQRETDPLELARGDIYDHYKLAKRLLPVMDFFHRENGHIREPHISIFADVNNRESCLDLTCDLMAAHMHEREAKLLDVREDKADISVRRIGLLTEPGPYLSRGGKNAKPFLIELLREIKMLPPEDAKAKTNGWSHPDAAPVAFLPARGFSSSEAKRLFDRASLADKDELLLEWMRFIEPRVRDIRYLSGPDSDDDVPYLKINGDMGRVPLASMGDGMTRLFHIGLAMANASGGILLIDEFENGLHWEAQEQLWKALFQAAGQFGVQVFATTHSTDCIRGFLAAQGEELALNENYVYRLERSGDEVYALELPACSLDAALRQQVEVR